MSTKIYTVRRPHQGDRWYAKGDEREALPAQVARLVARGVLVEKDDKAEQTETGDTGSGDGGEQVKKTVPDEAGGKSAPAAKDKAEPAGKDKSEPKAPASKDGAE